MHFWRSYLVKEAFYSVLQAPPLKLDRDKLVSTHSWAVRVINQFFL